MAYNSFSSHRYHESARGPRYFNYEYRNGPPRFNQYRDNIRVYNRNTDFETRRRFNERRYHNNNYREAGLERVRYNDNGRFYYNEQPYRRRNSYNARKEDYYRRRREDNSRRMYQEYERYGRYQNTYFRYEDRNAPRRNFESRDNRNNSRAQRNRNFNQRNGNNNQRRFNQSNDRRPIRNNDTNRRNNDTNRRNNGNHNVQRPRYIQRSNSNFRQQSNDPRIQKEEGYLTGKVLNLTTNIRERTEQPTRVYPRNNRIAFRNLNADEFDSFKKIRQMVISCLMVCTEVNRLSRRGPTIKVPLSLTNEALKKTQENLNLLTTKLFNETIAQRNLMVIDLKTLVQVCELDLDSVKRAFIIGIKYFRNRHGNAARPWKTCFELSKYINEILGWENTSSATLFEAVNMEVVETPRFIQPNIQLANINIAAPTESIITTTTENITATVVNNINEVEMSTTMEELNAARKRTQPVISEDEISSLEGFNLDSSMGSNF